MSKKLPELSISIVDPVPEAKTSKTEVPVLKISSVSSPAPIAETTMDSNIPEMLIQTVVNLVPRITDGDN